MLHGGEDQGCSVKRMSPETELPAFKDRADRLTIGDDSGGIRLECSDNQSLECFQCLQSVHSLFGLFDWGVRFGGI